MGIVGEHKVAGDSSLKVNCCVVGNFFDDFVAAYVDGRFLTYVTAKAKVEKIVMARLCPMPFILAQVLCSFVFWSYPFDAHTCEMFIHPQGVPAELMQFHGSTEFYSDGLDENALQYQVVDVRDLDAEDKMRAFKGMDVVGVGVKVHLKRQGITKFMKEWDFQSSPLRRGFFHWFNTYLPTNLLVFSSMIRCSY